MAKGGKGRNSIVIRIKGCSINEKQTTELGKTAQHFIKKTRCGCRQMVCVTGVSLDGRKKGRREKRRDGKIASEGVSVWLWWGNEVRKGGRKEGR